MGDIIHYERITNPGIYLRPVKHDTETITLESPFGQHIKISWRELKEEFTKTAMSGSRASEPDDGDHATTTFAPLEKTPMRLIGVAGQARSGKDTLADYLLENLGGEWQRSSFANPMKQMLGIIGVDCSDENKDNIDPTFGVSVRHMMQTLGTEWGRGFIDKDMWVKAFSRGAEGKNIIVPDVRFENEAELVRANGVMIHLVGRGGISGGHVSEKYIPFKEGDIVIDNSRDLEWMISQTVGNKLLNDAIFF